MLSWPWFHGVQGGRVQTEIRSALRLWSWETRSVWILDSHYWGLHRYGGYGRPCLMALWQAWQVAEPAGEEGSICPRPLPIQGGQSERHWPLTHAGHPALQTHHALSIGYCPKWTILQGNMDAIYGPIIGLRGWTCRRTGDRAWANLWALLNLLMLTWC